MLVFILNVIKYTLLGFLCVAIVGSAIVTVSVFFCKLIDYLDEIIDRTFKKWINSNRK